MASWVTTATGYRCERHGETFARGEVCRACRLDPGKPIDVTEEVNEHDRELELREGEVEQVARECYGAGRLLIKGTEIDAADGAKLIAEGTKAMRLACELRDKRAQREHDRMLVRHRREMAGIRKGN